MTEERELCLEHSGMRADISQCKEDRKDLRKNLRLMQRTAWVLVGGILLSLVTTLINYKLSTVNGHMNAKELAYEIVSELKDAGWKPYNE